MRLYHGSTEEIVEIDFGRSKPNKDFLWHGKGNKLLEKDMSDFDYMVECLERDMVAMLVEKRGMNMSQALDAFYNSETYEKLRDVRSGLFFQSSGYVYDFLDHEMNYGKLF